MTRTPLSILDDWLNGVTMYRLLVYGLVWLGLVAGLLSAVGTLSYPIEWLIKSGIALSIACGVTNYVLAWLYRLPSNQESSIITALIMFFVLKPPNSVWEVIGVGIAGGVAIVSKYALTWRGSVVVNPAAFGVLVVSLVGLSSGSWWVANKYMIVPTLLFGLLVLRKTRRFQLFAIFASSAIVLLLINGISLGTALYSFPIVFLGTIMLTEPATMPQTNRMRLAYALLAGLLVGSRLDLGFVSVSPHVALVVANLCALAMSRRAASVLTLSGTRQLTPTTWEYIFYTDRRVPFAAGQYAEFTFPGLWLDTRGNRRTFTIASSPTDQQISLGVKFYQPSSVYKTKLQAMKPGDTIAVAHVAGDFTLPKRPIPLLFIAGGIGITPFVSMMRDSVACDVKTDAVLLYFVANDQEVAYRSELDRARSCGFKTIVISGAKGMLDQQTLAEHVPDFASRQAYISGPPPMVRGYKTALLQWGVRRVKTDYFTGY